MSRVRPMRRVLMIGPILPSLITARHLLTGPEPAILVSRICMTIGLSSVVSVFESETSV